MKVNNGYLIIRKEKKMTSHDVVFRARKILKTKKIGHTGTLDPDAEGVLVLCVGKATKLAQYITDHEKMYEAGLIFGIETDTGDIGGKILYEKKSGIKKSELEERLKKFTGSILQKPPIYSAIKINGKKLYEYARESVDIEIPEREVHIREIRLCDFDESLQEATIEVTCSKGTYIRSLCQDIGRSLDNYGTMKSLIRKRVGDFYLKDARTLDEVQDQLSKDSEADLLIPMDFSLNHLKIARATEQGKQFLRNGNKLYPWNIQESFNDFEFGEVIKLYDDSDFIGMGKFIEDQNQNYIKPIRLL